MKPVALVARAPAAREGGISRAALYAHDKARQAAARRPRRARRLRPDALRSGGERQHCRYDTLRASRNGIDAARFASPPPPGPRFKRARAQALRGGGTGWGVAPTSENAVFDGQNTRAWRDPPPPSSPTRLRYSHILAGRVVPSPLVGEGLSATGLRSRTRKVV